jgi:hypothetical protein
MRNTTAILDSPWFSGFRRRPVLTAMMLYLVGLAAAIITVWWGSCGDQRRLLWEDLYTVRITAGVADRGETPGLSRSGGYRRLS